jgi:hypothetical protein
MFIVYGTQRKVRPIGWVADFCPMCRTPQQFRLSRIGMARHIYFLSVGSGELIGHLIECGRCGVKLPTDEHRYARFEKRRAADVAALAAKTMPDLPERLGERLALEALIATDPGAIDVTIRRSLLSEPFQLCEGLLAERAKRGREMDRPVAFGCFGTLGLVAIMAILLYFDPSSNGPLRHVSAALALLITLGWAYTIIQYFFIDYRYMRRQFIPRLATALRPLQPSREEISDALARCKQSKMIIGRKIDATKLWQAIQAQ